MFCCSYEETPAVTVQLMHCQSLLIFSIVSEMIHISTETFWEIILCKAVAPVKLIPAGLFLHSSNGLCRSWFITLRPQDALPAHEVTCLLSTNRSCVRCVSYVSCSCASQGVCCVWRWEEGIGFLAIPTWRGCLFVAKSGTPVED